MKEPVQNPVAIGGVGGSGTRVVAQFVDRMGFYIGDVLNPALDNLYFTLLFKRPSWFKSYPADREVSRAIGIFRAAMTSGLSAQVSAAEIDYVRQIGAQLERAAHPIGVEPPVADQLLDAPRPDLSQMIGWGWKEPNTHLFLPQLAADIDNLKYVHVLRHGLDIASSRNQQQLRNWNKVICGRAFDEKSPLPLQSLDYWIAANRRAIAIGEAHLGDRFLLLNYDALCCAPRQGISVLADFLDVRLPQGELEDLAALVAPKSTGRWKHYPVDLFTDEQLDAVRELGFDIDVNQ